MLSTDKVIMVLEDQDMQRQIVMRMLHSLNFQEVLMAANGREALELLNSPSVPQPEIVLCDLDMPEMDGMEFIRLISQAKPHLSVIITSSLDRPLLRSVEKMCVAYGARLLGTIEKPIDTERLMALLEQHTPVDRDSSGYAEKQPMLTLEQIVSGIERMEFRPFFQPKFNLLTGKLIGAEALVRWLHPQHGIVNPQAFLPVLERNRQMDDITFLMLALSAQSCRSWRQRGYEVPVSVNLSLVSLSDTTFAEKVLNTVRIAKLEPQHVTLEITETAATAEIAPVLENLSRLRMWGFGLSIDDYGTGFSSMQQLTRAPFSELKIDRSFVTGCAGSSEAQIIIQSSLAVAKGMAITTVAEGIETQADWELLREMGCDAAQGFFLAKPMDDAAFVDFCAAHA